MITDHVCICLLGSFHAYLVDQKLKEMTLKKRIEKRYAITSGQSYSIHWIETLLKTPIEDYRKNALALILVRILLTLKSCNMMRLYQKRMVIESDELQTVDSNFDYRIKSSIGYSAEKNNQLHKLLTQKVN